MKLNMQTLLDMRYDSKREVLVKTYYDRGNIIVVENGKIVYNKKAQ